jgi:hypothetical protein
MQAAMKATFWFLHRRCALGTSENEQNQVGRPLPAKINSPAAGRIKFEPVHQTLNQRKTIVLGHEANRRDQRSESNRFLYRGEIQMTERRLSWGRGSQPNLTRSCWLKAAESATCYEEIVSDAQGSIQ